jgi:hypothetical protein
MPYETHPDRQTAASAQISGQISGQRVDHGSRGGQH